MSSAVLPPAAPPPFKNRRGWLTAFGIAEILIGCVIVLFLGLAVFAMRQVPANASAPAPDARAIAMMAVFYVVLAFAFVIIGIGSIQARRWARVAMLIVGWTWLIIGIISTVALALLLPMIMSNAQQQATTPMPAGFDTIFRVVMMVFLGLFFILLPLVFVLFYSSKNVRLTCESASGAPSTRTKPVAVWVATIWFALGGVGYIFVFLRPVFPLMGVVLRGWSAVVTAIAIEIFHIWLSWNLYRQRALAWKVAIGWLIFGWISLLVTETRFGLEGMYRVMGYSDAEIALILRFAKYGLGIGAVGAVAFLIFLLATRKHFMPDTPSQAVVGDVAP